MDICFLCYIFIQCMFLLLMIVKNSLIDFVDFYVKQFQCDIKKLFYDVNCNVYDIIFLIFIKEIIIDMENF